MENCEKTYPDAAFLIQRGADVNFHFYEDQRPELFDFMLGREIHVDYATFLATYGASSNVGHAIDACKRLHSRIGKTILACQTWANQRLTELLTSVPLPPLEGADQLDDEKMKVNLEEVKKSQSEKYSAPL